MTYNVRDMLGHFVKPASERGKLHRPTARSFQGADTRYVPRATEPVRRRRGVVSHSQLVRR